MSVKLNNIKYLQLCECISIIHESNKEIVNLYYNLKEADNMVLIMLELKR